MPSNREQSAQAQTNSFWRGVVRRVLLLCGFLSVTLGLLISSASSVAKPSSIRVVLDDNYPPYVFRDPNGRIQGVLKDMWDLWQQRTGVAVALEPMDWNVALGEMRSGRADVIDTIFETPERHAYLDFTAPYASLEVSLFFHKSISGITSAASARGFTIGVKKGDACIDYLVTQGITDFKFFPSYEAEVKAAATQDVRLLCIDKPPAMYLFNREKVADNFRYSPPLYVGQFHRAVAKGNVELKQLVEEGFSRITKEEREAIDARWLGTALPNAARQAAVQYGFAVMLVAGVLLAALGTFSWVLRRRVATRTKELSLTLHSLKETENRFRALFEQANDAIFILHDYKVIDCNERAETLYQLPRSQIVGNTPLFASPSVQAGGRPSDVVLREMVERAQAGEKMVFEWRNLRPDGSVLDVEVNLSRIDFGGSVCLQALVRDITERKQAQEEIERLAFFDPLTHLPNRRLLQERLHQALSICERHRTTSAVLFIDLDNFKTLNDTRGHHVGDSLLKEVGRRLRKCVRGEDFIARLGGDEFVVLLENLTGSLRETAAQAESVAQKILDVIGHPFLLEGAEHHTSTSVGICLFTGENGETVEEILKRADAAMYRAKTAGRNALSFFDPAMQVNLEKRAVLEVELRRALPQQQLELFYQAKVDDRQNVVGAEALLRWRHPQRGMVAPAQFIAVAEETNLIVPIGQWVLETACTQLQKWNATPGMEHLNISVNVSARQFRKSDFVRIVSDIVEDTGVVPQRLTLELTESLVLDNVADAIEKMHALKALGIAFSMDDFGTGYSSLSYLKRLPLSELKIDQSFVRDIASDPSDEVIVRTIIAMARNLGLTVVGEGVETHIQLEFLRKYECDLFQGYLFGRPCAAGDFAERVLQKGA